MDVERVGEPDEHREERPDVDRLGDLRLRPAGLPQPLDLFVRDFVRVLGQRLDELQQKTLGRSHRRAIEVAVTQRLCGLAELLALQLQEPCMAAQSIVALVQRGDVRRDHLVLRPSERAVREVHPRGVHDGREKVRPVPHRHQDVGHELAADAAGLTGARRCEDLGGFSLCVLLFNPPDPGHARSFPFYLDASAAIRRALSASRSTRSAPAVKRPRPSWMMVSPRIIAAAVAKSPARRTPGIYRRSRNWRSSPASNPCAPTMAMRTGTIAAASSAGSPASPSATSTAEGDARSAATMSATRWLAAVRL